MGVGEVVFNTAMTGYQEVITDPSYRGQIIVMTYPLIGNYGVCEEDLESVGPHVEGFVVKELASRHSNFRATSSLESYLADHGVVGIEGIDTRAVTRGIRLHGALKGVVSSDILDSKELVRVARELPGLVGQDIVRQVAGPDLIEWSSGYESPFAMTPRGKPPHYRVVAIDCGLKRNILRCLVEAGCAVTVVPPTFTADRILELDPDGLFISNGPGDPEPVGYVRDVIAKIIPKTPTFGICMGHHLCAMAVGAKTYKLKFGHHGANHPVQNLATTRVEVTSQNHGFAVHIDSLEQAGGTPTHINLNDRTLEGFMHRDLPLFAIQYHPEASPGPHDATYLFDCFVEMMETGRAPTAERMAEAQKRLEQAR
jgi:carbamoyl-phosphate synthase small subunit